jgi:phosphotransferase system HPr (HPr) family protein
MKSLQVKIPWAHGLHARPASRLVRIARSFSSSIRITCNRKVANAHSIISLLLLSAALGATIQIDVTGPDEDDAADAVAEVFDSPDK